MGSRAALVAALLARSAAAGFADHFDVDDDVGVTKVPRFGPTRVLVIPVEVGDTHEWADAEAYFHAGPCDAGGLGPYTFRCYWHRVSAGRYDPEPVWAEPLHYATCPAPSGDCTFDLFGDPVNPFENSYRTLERLIDDLIARDGLDLSDFDLAGPGGTVPDGVMDGVLLLFDSADFEILEPCNSMAHSTELLGVGQLGLHWTTVMRLVERWVRESAERHFRRSLRRIGVDEVSYGRGRQKYLTIVWDHDRGGMVWIGQGREQETLCQFFDKLGPRGKK